MAIMASGATVSSAGIGRLSAACGSAATKQEGGMSSLAAISSPSSAVGGVAFGAGRRVLISGGRVAAFPQDFMAFHHRQGCTTTAQANNIAAVASVLQGEEEVEEQVPRPVVNIDEHSDPEATIVEISFGDRLGALLDTTKALKNLGLNVKRAQVTTDASQAKNKFFITRSDNGDKVEKPELLEAIRLTIINNLLKYHPESSEQLYLGEAFGVTAPKKQLDIDVATHVSVKKVDSSQSVLEVETADRPGLLLDIIKVVSDISVMVESAEINTEGLVAKDRFYVSYGGAALSSSLEEVLTNCLRYHIRKFDSEEDSY